MSIKKNIPARQKSFLARMGGVLKEVKGQKTLSPAYWSIRAWKKRLSIVKYVQNFRKISRPT